MNGDRYLNDTNFSSHKLGYETQKEKRGR